MSDNDPCGVCGSPVRLETRDKPRGLGQTVAGTFDVRVCTDPSCQTNGRYRRLGQTP